MQTTAIDRNHKIATALYIGNASDETYRDCFTVQELAELWEAHCIYHRDGKGNITPPDAPYDDEVYNALDRYGYWDNK